MEEWIGFDSRKRYRWVEREEVGSGKVREYRLAHAPGAIGDAAYGQAVPSAGRLGVSLGN